MNSVITSPSGNYTASIAAAGVPLQVHRRSGDQKPFVAGVPGSRYVITVRNLHEGRLLVVASVDGRSVLDEEEANWDTNRGMILHQGDSYRFTGFRLNDDQVGSFVFGSPDASVAAEATGSTENVGAIGLAGFPEPVYHARHVTTRSAGSYPKSWPGGQSMTYGMHTNSATRDIPVASAGAAETLDADLGTQMGEVQADHVEKGRFSRVGITPDVLRIGYASYESLVAAGIVAQIREGNPFPGNSKDESETGYRRFLKQ